jgi:hypothetical protein
MTPNLPSWLKVETERRPSTQLPALRFTALGEQDGPAARAVKARWLRILPTKPEIRRAFLVRACHEGSNNVHILLVLCSSDTAYLQAEDPGVPRAALIGSSFPLWRMIATAAQESELGKMCQPFYAAV